MTFKAWEKELKNSLKGFSKKEQKRIVEYYREMYDEMIGGGKNEDEILSEFGLPADCAQQVLNEEAKPGISKKQRKRFSAAEIVGLAFFTLLLVIPFCSAAFGIIVAFGAVSFSGGIVGLVGILSAIAYPFAGFEGASLGAGIGSSLVASGVGLILFVVFFYLTKGFALLLFKTLKAVYVRR